ncbi:PD-(D/E)XK nuclease family protein [Salegentibacter maritimus]|uniref:PD-(D/E)XK nuclease family protein n=1 Tax=Salegentibacter maritimus TaxID=2794347 RepID=A0ABS0TJ03_9FLAO|nr:PD-(D/E)XK nuclease family protein [Salegentibacter maritimus]MBI6121026.1 PD-(D/E)XK nuclease family protein [Salegentibacter maritimus]
MKLYFSTAYDQQVLKNVLDLNSKYIGTLGLLNILERELGLYKIFKDEKERATIYKDCLLENKEGRFYEKSLASDELNTAKQLLVIRDELILMGWNPHMGEQPIRLRELGGVENCFTIAKGYEGVADRWQNVINNLTQEKINEFNSLSISVMDDKHDLPNYLCLVFDKVKSIVSYESSSFEKEQTSTNLEEFKDQLYKSIYYPSDNTDTSKLLDEIEKDRSIQILNFKNEQLMVDCLAAYSNKNTVFINSENTNFDFSLVALGKSAAGSIQVQANPQVIQIIKLIIPCFSNELNLQSLISFLTLSQSPLEFILTQKLAKQLTKKPGVSNNDWNSILDCYTGKILEEEIGENEKKLLELFETESVSEDILKERKKQVDLFLTFNTPADKGVKKGKRIIVYLKKWAEEKRKSKSILELKEQFSYIEQLCENILKNFDFENENVSKLEDMIKSFYEAKNFTSYFKQADSVDVLGDISLIAEPINKEVFWIDFNAAKIRSSNQFLLKDEIKFLAENGWYNEPEKEIKLQLKQWLSGIINCKDKLILCTLENNENEKHPLHLRLASLIQNSTKKITISINSPTDFSKHFQADFDFKQSETINIPIAQSYLTTDALKNIKEREKESASSIEKFIEYPFDWVMQYVAKFSNNIGLDLPDENLLKGNVAHKTIELLFTQFPELDLNDFIIEEVFVDVIKSEAAIFLQQEKRFELSEFKYRFIKSFKNLVQLIKLNDFKIEALEYEFGRENTCLIDECLGNVNGYIDLFLKDPEDNPFIIDLKWGYSDKKYIKKIENNEAIQLAIYTAAIKDRDMAKTGYFMLNQNKFITAVKNLKGNNITEINSQIKNREVLDKIKTSLEFRWSELRQGRVEIGDNFSLSELKYYSEKGVISLPVDGKIKKEYPYSGYKLFKGMLK